MEFLVRIILTILLAPIWIIIGFSPAFLWEGYEGRAAKERKEAARREEQEARRAEFARRQKKQETQEVQRRAIAEWLAAHPVEAARINQEQRHRLMVDENERRARLAAVEEERRRAQQTLEAALAIPLSEEKAKLLSEMPFPPSLADLKRFADER
jgi:hypothetical protein